MRKGIMYNIDCDHFMSTRIEIDMGKNVDEAVLKKFIDQFSTTDVTDFVIGINGAVSAVPSKYITFYGDRANVKHERGKDVDYSNTVCQVFYNVWNVNGLDPYKIWIERCRFHGMNPWISYRINDIHCMFEDADALVPENYFENFLTQSRVRHREQTQYFDRTKDYELEEVRQNMLNYIDETLAKYDVYGIELDYQREFECFRIGHEIPCRDLMTGFVKKVKSLVGKYEQKYNHKIKIAIRALESPINCEELGLDILEWAKQGYMDLYVAAPRWWTTNNDMPIRLWKQILEPYGVEVAGSLEYGISPHPDALRDINTVESAFGTANNILSQGADQLYLYNYYPESEDIMPGNFSSSEYVNSIENRNPAGLYKLMVYAGSLDKLAKHKRRNIVTFTEKLPLGRRWDNILPLQIVTLPDGAGEKWAPGFEEKFTPGFIRIPTGYVSDTDTITLRLGVSDGINAEDLIVYVNSTSCTFAGIQDCGKPYLFAGKLICFDVPAAAMQKTYVLMAEIIKKNQSIKDFYVDYVDVVVEPKGL